MIGAGVGVAIGIPLEFLSRHRSERFSLAKLSIFHAVTTNHKQVEVCCRSLLSKPRSGTMESPSVSRFEDSLKSAKEDHCVEENHRVKEDHEYIPPHWLEDQDSNGFCKTGQPHSMNHTGV